MYVDDDVRQKNTNRRGKEQEDFSQASMQEGGKDETRDGIREGEMRVHWECRAWRASLQREKKRPLLLPRGGGCCQEHQFLSPTHSLEYKHISPLMFQHVSPLKTRLLPGKKIVQLIQTHPLFYHKPLIVPNHLDKHFERSGFRWWKCVLCTSKSSHEISTLTQESVFIMYST